MTAPADLAEVRAALALVAQATPGPWSARIFTTHVVDSCQQTQWHEVGSQHGTICEAPPSVFEDETAIGASNIRAIVALHNAAPAIAAAVEELERLRTAVDEREGDMHLRIRAGYDKTVADAWRAVVAKRDAEIAALRGQVCRLVSGHAIESDSLCQHHGADAAAEKLVDGLVAANRPAPGKRTSIAPAAPATVGGLLATAPIGAVVEWLSEDHEGWCRTTVGQSQMVISRWFEYPPKWTRPGFGMYPGDLRLPARLVHADQADADPETRGPIGGGK